MKKLREKRHEALMRRVSDFHKHTTSKNKIKAKIAEKDIRNLAAKLEFTEQETERLFHRVDGLDYREMNPGPYENRT